MRSAFTAATGLMSSVPLAIVTADTAMQKPSFIDDPAYKCLRVSDFEGFHKQVANRDHVDFSHANLRGVDFRQSDLSKVILTGAYLRDADLRGLDLREMDLEGCSLIHAKVSGTYFPPNLSPEEIRMSLEYGTRLRMMHPS